MSNSMGRHSPSGNSGLDRGAAGKALALTLAADTGIEVPEWRLVPQNGSAVLLLNRFDRRGKHRIPFLSAMSMLGAVDLDDTQASIELAVETAPYYDLSTSDARRIAREAAERIRRWRDVAKRLGLARPARGFVGYHGVRHCRADRREFRAAAHNRGDWREIAERFEEVDCDEQTRVS